MGDAFGNALGGSLADAASSPSYSTEEMAGDYQRENNRFAAAAAQNASADGSEYAGGQAWAADVAARRAGGSGRQLDELLAAVGSDGVSVDTRPGSIYVQAGDSLSKIAARFPEYGNTNDLKNQLISANPQLRDPNALTEGMELNFPGAGTVVDRAAMARAVGADGRYQAALAAQQPDAQELAWSFREASMAQRKLDDARELAEYQARLASQPMQYVGPVDVAAQRAADVRRESLLNFLNGQGNMALGGVFAAGAMIGTGDVVVASQVSDALEPIDSLLAPMGGGSRAGASARVRGVRGSPSPLLPMEGNVGTYDDLIASGTKGDNVTPHHIPSAKHMGQYGIPKGDGIAINMEMPSPGSGGRHRDTFTYGNSADVDMGSRNALAAGIRDARSIYQRDGLYDAYIRQQLQDVVRQNKATYPDVFKKP